jgi:hypothetical protein
MTIPDRTSAAAMLLSLEPPIWHLRHSRAVAEIAAWLAARAAGRGLAIDRRLVEAAALLHDVDKLLPASDPAGHLPHGAGSAAWLARQGYAELGPAVAAHPVTGLAGDDAEAWLEGAALEVHLVAYADKRAGQRLEPMARRFASWERRYPDGRDAATAAVVRERADRLERDVCDRLAADPLDIGRIRWTGAALRRAEAAREAAA